MPERDDITEQNRRAWNEIAAVREAAHQRTGTFKPSIEWRAGAVDLPARVVETMGDARDATMLHLQCATGRDSMSWANVGAHVTGIDISDVAIDIARANAADAGLDIRFIASDLYRLPDELQAASFDLAYTSGGVLCWLPDIEEWARVIARALRAGGRFLLWEEHPVAQCFEVQDGRLVFEYDYFSRGDPLVLEPGWSFFDAGDAATEKRVEFTWPVGDIVTALARAGMRIELLEESPPGPGQRYRFGDRLETEARRIPGDLLLVARKE